MPKKGGRRKKSRTQPLEAPKGANLPESVADNIPRSIVARISKVNPVVSDLIKDIRKLMGPYTAMNLKEKRYNRMKDYEAVSSQLGVSHLLLLSQTETSIIMRIAKVPGGPTLHFKIKEFMLPRQIKAIQKRPYESLAAYNTPPVLVLNNFSQSTEQQVKLMKITFQNMFPTINVKTVKLGDCRRVVLFHYNKEDDIVELRHYAIRANPVGISRTVRRVIQAKIPDLSNLEDISEFLEGSNSFSGSVSDSEVEDESSRVTLPERYIGRGNARSQQSAMKLIELGPRLSFSLYKVEQGVNEGDILYHKFVQKSPEEAAATKARIEKAKKLKEERRKGQQENVKRKRDAVEEKRRLKEEKKRQRLENGERSDSPDEDSDEENDENDELEEEDFEDEA